MTLKSNIVIPNPSPREARQTRTRHSWVPPPSRIRVHSKAPPNTFHRIAQDSTADSTTQHNHTLVEHSNALLIALKFLYISSLLHLQEEAGAEYKADTLPKSGHTLQTLQIIFPINSRHTV